MLFLDFYWVQNLPIVKHSILHPPKYKYWPKRDIICIGDDIKCDTIFELPLVSKMNEMITTTNNLFTLTH
jgi:hypothetical protein